MVSSPEEGRVPEPIVMYARTRPCPDVARARGRLTELGLEWREYDTEADEDAAGRARALNNGTLRVPTLLLGGRVLVEPSVEELDAGLIAAGYELSRAARPAGAVPPARAGAGGVE
jgi:glutaredoxin